MPLSTYTGQVFTAAPVGEGTCGRPYGLRVVRRDLIITHGSRDHRAIPQTGATAWNISLRAELKSENRRLGTHLPGRYHGDTRVRYSRMIVERIAVAALGILRLSIRLPRRVLQRVAPY
jgi:hypothetical protein